MRVGEVDLDTHVRNIDTSAAFGHNVRCVFYSAKGDGGHGGKRVDGAAGGVLRGLRAGRLGRGGGAGGGVRRDPGARTQAWRLLQQPAVRRRLQELRYSAQASETAFAARLMARAERLWDAAQAEDNHGLALRVMQMQFRIAGRYGAPPTSLVMGDEATLNDLTLTALVAETRRIELPAGVDIGPDVRAAAMTRPGGRVPHPGLPPRGKGRCEEGGEPSHPPGRVPHPGLPPGGKGQSAGDDGHVSLESHDDSFPRLRQARDDAGSDGEQGEDQTPQPGPSASEEGQPPHVVPSPLGEGQDGGRAEGASDGGDGLSGCREQSPRVYPRASVNMPLDDSLPARRAGPGLGTRRPPAPPDRACGTPTQRTPDHAAE